MKKFWMLASASATVFVCAALIAGSSDIRRFVRMHNMRQARTQSHSRGPGADRRPGERHELAAAG
jgi:hypothetical protein